MSHPTNKKDRIKRGVKKSFLRSIFHFPKKDILDNPDWVERDMKHHRNTTKICSCPMCGNPRKYFNEKTRQEKQNDRKNNEY